MRLRTALLALTLALTLVLGLAACGSDAVRSGGSRPTQSPNGAPSEGASTPAPTEGTEPPDPNPDSPAASPQDVVFPDAPPLPRRRFLPAYRRWVADNSHRVSVETVGTMTPDSPIPTLQLSARFSIRPLAMDLRIEQGNLSAGDPQAPEKIVRRNVIADRRLFARVGGFPTPFGDCWLGLTGADVDPTEVGQFTPEIVRTATARPTLAFLSPLMLLDRYRPSDGTTALGAALPMLGLDRIGKMDPRIATLRLPVVVVAEDGRIAEVQITAAAVAAGFEEAVARLDAPSQLNDLARLLRIRPLSPQGWRVRYEAPGEPVTVTAPTRLYDPVTETCP